MRVGITGYRGRVGSYLLSTYPNLFVPLKCDVTDMKNVGRAINDVRPDLILHLASKSDVDFCENNSGTAISTNVEGTFNVLVEAEKIGRGVVLLSSAYVFKGDKWFGKYAENEHCDPVNVYGYTKFGAESFKQLFDNMKIIRTSYLFDEDRLAPILSAYRNGETQNFPTFIRRSFMWLPHFASQLVPYLLQYEDMPNILHLAGSESPSWYDFVRDLFDCAGYDTNKVLPRKQKEDGHAPRGNNLGLSVSLSNKLGFPQFSYMDGIRKFLK